MSNLALNCLVLDDPRCRPFMLDVESGSNVGTLKKAVYGANKYFFEKVKIDMDDLLLYFPPALLNEPGEELLMQALDAIDYSLLPNEDVLVSSVLPSIPRGRVHVLAVSDQAEMTTRSTRNATVGTAKSYKQQSEQPIHSSGPNEYRGPPITIYHEAFAHLKDDLDHIDDIVPTSDEVKITLELLTEGVKFSVGETERSRAILSIMEKFFDCQIRTERHILSARSSGVIETDASGWLATISLFEIKNEVGSKGECKNQATCTYCKRVASDWYARIRASTCCPSLIITFMGPFVTIQGAILIDVPVVQPFAEIFFPGGGPDYEQRVLNVARILHATKEAIARIRRYYRQVELSKTLNREALLPHPVPIGGPNPFPRIQIVDSLFKKNMASTLFTATIDNRKVIVKFTSRYCAEAHRLLADNSLAPLLHFCAPVLGGHLMVVMEHVQGDTKFFQTHGSTREVYDDVKRAVELLHSEDYVFGDLRPSNIMVIRKEVDSPLHQQEQHYAVRLIDFDWCGKDMVSRYPAILNTAIGWAPGIMPFGIMKKEHDEYQLAKLQATSG